MSSSGSTPSVGLSIPTNRPSLATLISEDSKWGLFSKLKVTCWVLFVWSATCSNIENTKQESFHEYVLPSVLNTSEVPSLCNL